jgi:lipopolysaccharide transport system ATP-binding protein
MSNAIHVENVTLDYPIYTVTAQSLRSTVFNAAVGGRMYQKSASPVVRALSGVSFSITEGDRLALLGHNGSGKTTLLKVIAGIYEPTVGRVTVHGSLTSTIAAGAGLDMELTGLENIRNLATTRLVPRKLIEDKMDSIIEFSGLAQFIKLPVRTYSAGMVARLMFAVTTAFDPDVLILDEWLGAGDADFVHKAEDRMKDFVNRASILVLATHSVDLVKHVCNKVCVMEGGRIKFFGATEDWFSGAYA